MTLSTSRRLAAPVTLLGLSTIALLAIAAEPAAPAKEMGDLWEVTSQMSIEGMPMALPAQKLKVCSPKDWTEPPVPADERRKCTTSDFQKEPDKVTWKTVCAGPPEMKGEGEITRSGADAYEGSIKFTSEEASMTTRLNGKLLGTCELPAKK